MMKTDSKNSMAGISTDRIMLVLFAFLIASVAALGVTYIFVAQEASLDKTYISKIGDQRVISQEIAKLTSQAARGDLTAFPLLTKARDSFQEILEYQKGVTPIEGSSAMGPLSDLNTAWQTYRENVDIILERQEVVNSMRSYIQGINEQIPSLLALSDEVVDTMAKQKAPPYQVYIATRQLMLTQRISSNVGKVLEGGEEAVTAADRFGRDAALFGRVVQDMLKGNPNLRIQKIIEPTARKKLSNVAKQFYKIRNQVGAILERSPEMFQVSASAEEVLEASESIHTQIQSVADSYQGVVDARWTGTAATVLGALALIFAVAVGFVYWRDSQMTLQATEEQRRLEGETNTANQEAILRLLDEMGDLADGDLTVMATVTEDITGAIADSINYAIDALRSLVSAINETTLQVSSAAQQTQATAMHLAEASDHQAQQITGASSAINEMAVSIEGVSTHASELADEARKSVTMANSGSDAVQKTINGMDSIRETIQETSKRIKRLGESSQEIGDIVELINDIAEQTNILALNAAIQAAMAGDAGRGFAVVADEVQRLAERSADATKQIEALVKGIQSDTKEAVASMEQSTAGVVSGAQLAQDAGQALEQIESVSEHLADLIRNISESASQQANAASNISDTMNVIQEITTQTSAGTNETAASIGNLAELANELRRSVAGFKLPE